MLARTTFKRCLVLEAGGFSHLDFKSKIHVNSVVLYPLSYPDLSGAGLEPATSESAVLTF